MLNKIASLASESADAPPTDQTYDVQAAVGPAAEQMSKLDTAVQKDLPQINQLLQRQKLPPIARAAEEADEKPEAENGSKATVIYDDRVVALDDTAPIRRSPTSCGCARRICPDQRLRAQAAGRLPRRRLHPRAENDTRGVLQLTAFARKVGQWSSSIGRRASELRRDPAAARAVLESRLAPEFAVPDRR
jgi:hypothetical protein